MGGVYLAARREFLRRTQNPDGGWGYFPSKASWLEPTAYAMLALHGAPDSNDAIERAWKLMGTWQLPDGSWRAGAQVMDGTWVTALAVTLCSIRQENGSAFQRGLEYLLDTSGAETRTIVRVLRFFGFGNIEVDPAHPGWPWRGGNSSWIEPTAHTLIALKRAQNVVRDRRLRDRVREGEQMVLSRQCRDGGWNYGNRTALGMELPSYPETTALGLLALQGSEAPVQDSLALARKYWTVPKWPLAHAWLSIALRVWGETVPAPDEEAPTTDDVLLTALEAIGHPDGNFRLLQVGRST